MKYCDKCGLSVKGARKRCPLCQGDLRPLGGEEGETFPEIPTMLKKYNLFFRILIFVSVVSVVVSVVINVMLPEGGWWSFFVFLGVLCMWVLVAVSVNRKRNISKTVLYLVVLLSLTALLWDWVTGWRGWSLDYAVPILCTAAMIAMSIVAKILNLPLEDYLIYTVIDAVFGIVPLVFLLTGVLAVILPSLLCVGISVISMAALFLFEGERMMTELRRRLHI